MSTVTGTTAGNSATGTATKPTGAMKVLGKDTFLQLMVTQMRYQDPLNPQDNSAFVAQMAQFTSLEQMQNLNATMSKILDVQSGALNHAPAYLGLSVTVGKEDGTLASGIVSGVEYENGKPLLVIGGNRYGLESLQKVSVITETNEGTDNVV
jgi:flagellar basal-body rod modification protein FlgD